MLAAQDAHNFRYSIVIHFQLNTCLSSKASIFLISFSSLLHHVFRRFTRCHPHTRDVSESHGTVLSKQQFRLLGRPNPTSGLAHAARPSHLESAPTHPPGTSKSYSPLFLCSDTQYLSPPGGPPPQPCWAPALSSSLFTKVTPRIPPLRAIPSANHSPRQSASLR